MKPYWQSDAGKIYQGHVLEALRALPDEFVHCCITSPPYWGLRDYGLEPQIWDGDADCEHVWGDGLPSRGQSGWHTFEHKYHSPGSHKTTIGSKMKETQLNQNEGSGSFCQLCGAWRGSLGLEPTPELYVKHIVDIFREVKRVLRNDGTFWLNLGDSYCGGGRAGTNGHAYGGLEAQNRCNAKVKWGPPTGKIEGLKPKDLVGIPWRVAFALQADGWYLRSDIIWNKKNPMPESCTDRPTKSHEYLFLMSKNQKYFYDNEAIKEASVWPDGPNSPQSIKSPYGQGFTRKNIAYSFKRKTATEGKPGSPKQHRENRDNIEYCGNRNKRSVWTIATQPFPAAHFATFPPKLVEPCILAGTSEKGCCVECGAPWERVVDVSYKNDTTKDGRPAKGNHRHNEDMVMKFASGERTRRITKTIGWQPGCKCYGTDPLPTYPKQGEDESDEVYQVRCEPIRLERIKLCKLWEPLPAKPGTILDLFIGACTTGIVAYKHDRKFIGIDLSETYLKDIAVPRIERETQQLKMFN